MAESPRSSTRPGNTPLPDFPPAQTPTGQPPTSRRTSYTLAAILTSVFAGLALVRFPSPIVIGAVLCALTIYVILTKPFVGLLLYTVTFMLRPGQLLPQLSALHVERIVGALALGGMYLEQHRNERRLLIDGTRQTRLLLLIAVMVLASVPFAYDRPQALGGFIDFLKLVAWYVLVVHLIDTSHRLRVYVTLFLGLICYIAFDSFRGYLTGNFQFTVGIERAVGQTDAGGDPNTLAATMSATIPILLLLTFYKPLRWLRLLPASGTLLLAVTMSLTGSRSGLLGFSGGLLCLWSQIRHRLLVGMIGLAILALGIWALPEQYKARYSTIGQSQLDSSSVGRLMRGRRGCG